LRRFAGDSNYGFVWKVPLAVGLDSMAQEPVQIVIKVDPGTEVDPRALERLSRNLRNDLNGLDGVHNAELVHVGAAPPGAKAAGAVDFGSIFVTLAASGGVFTALIGVLQGWLRRSDERSLTLQMGSDKLELKGYSSQEQEQLVQAFLRRHAVSPE
jgi:membrane-associated two-gene conflict system component 1 (EACC1)